MARIVSHAKLESPSARAKLKRGRQPHLQSLVTGKAALGYQRQADAPSGRWFVRRNIGGRYLVKNLGLADDDRHVAADGSAVLTFEQARAKALEVLAQGSGEDVPRGRLTVRKICARYIEAMERRGQRTLETERRFAALVLPELGDLEVSELTAERIRKWHAGLASRPALLRSGQDAKKRNTKAPPEDEEAVRRRRASANRVLTMLKAALNNAYDEQWVSNNEAWGRRVKPFRDVDAARMRYLQVVEAKRLINASPSGFRDLVQAALQTGARYSELCRLLVEDFNPDAGTIHVRRSKSGKGRHVILSDEGVAFFTQLTAGRAGDEWMLHNHGRVQRALARERERLEKAGKPTGKPNVNDRGDWRAAEQGRLMRDACEHGKIKPPISFHGLRHTWASLAAMAGVPLLVIAKNLGHTDTRMVEKHYGHLAPSYVADAIRAGAPKFGFKPDKKVVGLAAR
jgi:integrase